MGTAASALINPIAPEPSGVGSKLTAEALSRRAKQRRQIQHMIGGNRIAST
jgi:diguanylate cyclase